MPLPGVGSGRRQATAAGSKARYGRPHRPLAGRTSEEDDGHCLAKAVQLQASGANGIHDGCVVHHTHLQGRSMGENAQVKACRCMTL